VWNDSELVLDLIVKPPIPTIHAVTPTHRITFGFSEDLNEAMVQALNAMLDWMQLLLNLDKLAALAVASSTLDLRITQVVNDVWGVHAALPMEIAHRNADVPRAFDVNL
jgi:acetamidase/formamidase